MQVVAQNGAQDAAQAGPNPDDVMVSFEHFQRWFVATLAVPLGDGSSAQGGGTAHLSPAERAALARKRLKRAGTKVIETIVRMQHHHEVVAAAEDPGAVGLGARVFYAVSLPLVLLLSVLPDMQDPRKQHLYLATFAGSIAFIGVFSCVLRADRPINQSINHVCHLSS